MEHNKKKRTFQDWVNLKKILEKDVKTAFTVPPHINVLPCGCVKQKEFLVIKKGDALMHYKRHSEPECPPLMKVEKEKKKTKYYFA